MQFGGIYDFKKKTITKTRNDPGRDFPKCIEQMVLKIEDHLNLKSKYFNQIIVNRYEKNMCINPHIDDRNCFDERIVTVS